MSKTVHSNRNTWETQSNEHVLRQWSMWPQRATQTAENNAHFFSLWRDLSHSQHVTCKQLILDYEYPWFLKYSKPPNIICLGLKPYKVSLYALTFLGQNLTNNSSVFVFKDRMGKQLKHAQGVLPTETFLSLQSQVSAWLQLAEMKARSDTC